jgi:hypothetical protein
MMQRRWGALACSNLSSLSHCAPGKNGQGSTSSKDKEKMGSCIHILQLPAREVMV